MIVNQVHAKAECVTPVRQTRIVRVGHTPVVSGERLPGVRAAKGRIAGNTENRHAAIALVSGVVGAGNLQDIQPVVLSVVLRLTVDPHARVADIPVDEKTRSYGPGVPDGCRLHQIMGQARGIGPYAGPEDISVVSAGGGR